MQCGVLSAGVGRGRRGAWPRVAVGIVVAIAALPRAATATPAARREARRAAESAVPPAAVPGQPSIVIRRGLFGRPRVIMAPGLVPAPGRVGAAPAAPVVPPVPAVAPPAGSASPPAGSAGPSKVAAGTAGTVPPTTSSRGAAAVAATPPVAAVPMTEAIPAPRPLPTGDDRGFVAAGAAAVETFSAAWFAVHPDAWRPETAGRTQPADAAAITAWIGQGVSRAGGAASPQGSVNAAGGTVNEPSVGPDGLRSVLVLPTGRDEPVAPDEWLPLGAFALVHPVGTAVANEQQLFVDRGGAIRGSFHDPLSGSVQPVTGIVDRSTRTASWTVGSGPARFECGLDAFATAPARVVVTAGGTTRSLDLVPLSVSN